MLPFKCPYCGKYFCIEHRLPENHNCPNSPSRSPLGPAQHPSKDPYLLTLPKNKRKTEAFVSEGPLHFKKRKDVVKPASLNSTEKKKPIGKVLVVALIALIGVALFINGHQILASIQDFISSFSYTKVKVIASVPQTVEIEGNTYIFFYSSQDRTLLVGVQSTFVGLPFGNCTTVSLSQTKQIEVYGIEIVVKEIHSDYVLLYVRPV